MFEFFLSVRVSCWLVVAGRMPRRCAVTTFYRTRQRYRRKLCSVSVAELAKKTGNRTDDIQKKRDS